MARRQRGLVVGLFGLIILLVMATGHAAEPSLISLDDLYRFDSPQGLVIAPDGATAIYARRWADRSSRTVRFSLWRVDGEAANRRPLEEGEPDGRSPLISPDGKWVVFFSTRPLPDGQSGFEPVPP